MSGHPLVNVHMEDASDDFGVGLIYLRFAMGSGTVPVGRRSSGHPASFGGAPLAHRRPLSEVVQLYFADGRHEAKGLHVDRVGHGLKIDLVRLDDLHEGGGWVHTSTQEVPSKSV